MLVRYKYVVWHGFATFVADGGRAYVCVGETCAPPTTDAAAVTDLVRSYGLRGRR